MLKIHEHMVRVSSGLDPLSRSLTKAQLWQWLEWYVRHPHEFTEAMERSVVQERIDQNHVVLDRELDFGSLKVRDRVMIETGCRIRTEISASEHWPASALTITLEQPKANGSMFLRFVYEEQRDEPMGDDMISNLRRKAYEQKDRDMVDLILQKASEGSSIN